MTPDEVPIRPASTVMLVRDSTSASDRSGSDPVSDRSGRGAGIEVFTLRRVAQMVFAAGMTVFPGGGVDMSDADESIPWTGPDPAWWAEQWRIGRAAARAQVVAAVRELYEETGVLLAHREGAVAVWSDAAPDRAAVTAHRLSLAALLRARGARLSADLLRPWARWITPPGQVRRYDTYFFVAALPDGQQPDFATSEAAAGGWQRPAEVLRAGEAGEVGLLPPTVAMMTDLAAARSVADLLATPRMVEPVMPTVLSADGEVLRVRAGDREYQTRLRPR